MSKFGLTLAVIDGKVEMKFKSEKASVGDLSSSYVQLDVVKQQILREILKLSNINVQKDDKKK
jgi:hypothetical protein